MNQMSDPQWQIQAVYDAMSEAPGSEHERILREAIPGFLGLSPFVLDQVKELLWDVAERTGDDELREVAEKL